MKEPFRKVNPLTVFILGLSLVLSGCSSVVPIAGSGQLWVVTTVSPITNIIKNIGGSHIQLTGLIPEGSDSHTFEPVPSDAKVLAQADIIFVNGLKLEEPTVKMAEANKKDGAEIVQLGEQTIMPGQYIYDFSFPKENGSPNPHLWMNPIYALRYAEIVRDTLVARDPAHADDYRKNFEAYKSRVQALDQAIKATIETIPLPNRKLLTYHDSFAYFASRYGLIVVGAIQPSDFSEPTARDVANLINQIKQEKVPAIFGSEVYPSPVLDQIARESGAKYVDKLRDDALPGNPGDPNHTYIGLMIEDVTLMAKYLGGDPAKMNGFDPRDLN